MSLGPHVTESRVEEAARKVQERVTSSTIHTQATVRKDRRLGFSVPSPAACHRICRSTRRLTEQEWTQAGAFLMAARSLQLSGTRDVNYINCASTCRFPP